MRFSKGIVLVGLWMGLLQSAGNALACGDYCDWGGLYNTTGYTGYGLGSTLYDISTYSSTTVTIDYGSSGGCGSFTSSCGSYTPSVCNSGCGTGGGSIDFGPSLYGDMYGSPQASPYSSNPYASNPYASNPYLSNPTLGGMANPQMFNPMSYTGNGQFMDPTSQMLMASTLGMPMSPYNMTNIFSMMGPQSFNPYQQSPMGMYPFPGFNPQVNNPSLLPPNLYPGNPNVGQNYPPSVPMTNPYRSPNYPYGNYVPPSTNTPPTTPTISQPPTTPLVWGGCDNVIVMCPTGTVTRPTTTIGGTSVPTPLNPNISVTPNYQTVPTEPVRYQVPRGTH